VPTFWDDFCVESRPKIPVKANVTKSFDRLAHSSKKKDRNFIVAGMRQETSQQSFPALSRLQGLFNSTRGATVSKLLAEEHNKLDRILDH
jgi:hypothetical protein